MKIVPAESPEHGKNAGGPGQRLTMSVVHVCAPAKFGGLESVVRALSTGFVRRGHRVSVIAVVEPGDDADDFLGPMAAVGVETHQIVVSRRGYFSEARRVRELVRSIGPSVLHSHGHRADLVHPMWARAAGIATVSTLHGYSRRGGRVGLFESLQTRLAGRLDAVIAVSATIRDRLIAARVRPERINFVPNALVSEGQLGREDARSVLGLPEGPFVGWVGRMVPVKGLDIFIEAFGRLRTLDARACVIGEGPQLDDVRARVQALGIEDRVHFAGAVPNAGLLMRAFDVYALSSRSEGTPIALLEAIVADVPVVCTAVGGVPDVVSDGTHGWLVPSESPDGLASALDEALTDRVEATRRAEVAHQRIRLSYGADDWLARHEAIYDAAVAARASDSWFSRPVTG